MPTVTLSTLLNPFTTVPKAWDRSVTGLTLDSRNVNPGDVFFACQGTQLDGRHFIDAAIKNGAVAIVSEATSTQSAPYLHDTVPVFPTKNLNHQLSVIAAAFYDHPAQSLCMIGVTGTNGKTSCCHFIALALQHLNIPCAVIGTLGNGMLDNLKPGNLTTPDAITLQATLADLRAQGAEVVAMEVSSHSIDQGRINGIPFAIGIFTNLTRDHLDYHGDMATYGSVKKRLFDNPLLQTAIINADDAFGKQMIAMLQIHKTVFAYSAQPTENLGVPLVAANNVQLDVTGLHARVTTPWGKDILRVPLVGQFNISNVLAVLTTLGILKIPLPAAISALAELKSVPGRMQVLGGKQQPLVVVDYAHTPDALEKVLMALREHCQGRLFCLFGCGGDRDRGKRPLMARIAEQYADVVILTDDNPRHELPAQIVADIMQGFSQPARIIVQHDRSQAIEYIIQCAIAGDCVLIAGKGAEMYQQIGDKKIAFSDVEKVKGVLNVATVK